MTTKEYSIIMQFVQAFVDVAYARHVIKVGNKDYGCITVDDANDLLERIRILVDYHPQ